MTPAMRRNSRLAGPFLAAVVCLVAVATPRTAHAFLVDPPAPSFAGIGSYAQGQFLTTDPVLDVDPGNPHTWNKYGFVRGNPLLYIDPDGRATKFNQAVSDGYHGLAAALRSIPGLDATPVTGMLPGVLDAAGDAFLLGETADVIVDGGDGYDIASAAARDAGRVGFVVLTVAGLGQPFNATSPKLGSSGGPGARKAFARATKDEVRTGTCVFCKAKTTREPGPLQSNIDHAQAKAKGGNNSLANAQETCQTCNLDKRTESSWVYAAKKLLGVK